MTIIIRESWRQASPDSSISRENNKILKFNLVLPMIDQVRQDSAHL